MDEEHLTITETKESIPEAKEGKRPLFNISWGWFSLIVFMLCTLTVTIYLFETMKKPVEATKEILTAAIEAVTNPHGEMVTMVNLGRGMTVAEINTYQQEVSVNQKYSTTWGGSTKKITYSQTYVVKYGVDLNNIRLSEGNALDFNVFVTSVTPEGAPVIESENGWWNKIQDEERSKVEKMAVDSAKETAMMNGAALELAKLKFLDILNRTAPIQNSPIKFTLD